jgi:hypothetical protein
MARRYCVTQGVLQLAVDMGGRPHKGLACRRLPRRALIIIAQQSPACHPDFTAENLHGFVSSVDEAPYRAGDSQTAQKFVLSSRDWFDLQTRLQSVMSLPYNYGEYETRYGSASSGLQMKDCFAAMNRLQGVAAKYGNPRQLRSKILKDPNFLANADRPKNDVYSATVWTLEQAHQDAFSLAT